MSFEQKKKYLTFIALLPVYSISHFIPRSDNIFVYGCRGGEDFTDNSKHLFIQAQKTREQTRHIWLTRDRTILEELRSKGYDAYMFSSIVGQYYTLRARCSFITHEIFDIPWWMSGNMTIIRLGHGIPFKKYRWANTKEVNDMGRLKKFVVKFIIDNIDYTIASSENYVPKVAEALDISEERVWVTGLPRMDYLLSEDYEGDLYMSEEVEEIMSTLDKYNRSVLYFPTWRRNEKSDPYFFDGSINKVNTYLKRNNIVMFVKSHPEANEKNIEGYSNIIGIGDSGDFYPLVKVTDALITDYSSIFYDYLYKGDQIIFYPHDLKEYRSNRDLFFDYKDLPGDIIHETESLLDTLSDSGKSRSGPSKQDISKWQDKAFYKIDSNNSVRVLEHVEDELIDN